jgi:hypothetical protein
MSGADLGVLGKRNLCIVIKGHVNRPDRRSFASGSGRITMKHLSALM